MGGLVYGLAPLAIFWFAVLPLKGLGAGGGFDPAAVPIHVGFHEAFGIGLAIIFQAALNRGHRRIQA